MSIRVMSAVWERSQHSGTDLLMLLALADFSDDQGKSYPSVAKLATKCRTTPRHANRLISALVDGGELEVQIGRGPAVPGGRLNLYRVRLEALKEMTDTSGVTNTSGLTSTADRGDTQGTRGDVDVPKGVTQASVKPSLNRQRNREEPNTARARKRAAHPARPSISDLLPEVTPQVLDDWLEVRKAKRVGPVSETVAKLLRSEASKAGLSLQQAVEVCCARGWASLKAEWLQTRANGAHPPPRDDAAMVAAVRQHMGQRADFSAMDYTAGIAK